MPRIDVNRSGEMEVFVQVVDSGGFSAAARELLLWYGTLAPAISAGKRLAIVAHGNSIRALVKHLNNISDADIVGVNIPNGIPLVYELDASMKPTSKYYLGGAEAAAQAATVSALQADG